MSALVFYDGDCGACNRFVQWVLAKNSRTLYFAPLQGTTASDFFGGKVSLESLIFIQGWDVYYQSDAVLRAILHCTPNARWARALLWIPAGIRNWGYRRFARVRRAFGTPATCRLLTSSERRRFLP